MGEAVRTATYLINKALTPILQNRTLFDLFVGKSLSIDHLRIFGCLCYMNALPTKRDKLDPRAVKGVFIGYPYNKKSYKVYCLHTHCNVVSMNVRFHEAFFPFQDVSPSSSPPIHVPIVSVDSIDLTPP